MNLGLTSQAHRNIFRAREWFARESAKSETRKEIQKERRRGGEIAAIYAA